MDTIINDFDFFIGTSTNPLHLAMKIPFHIIKLAHLSSLEQNLEYALNNELEKISFSVEEKRKFVSSQIAANNFLQSHGQESYSIYHLTPRLLLPFQVKDISPIDPKQQSTIINIEIQDGSKRKKKKKKSKSKVIKDVETISSPDDHFEPNTINYNYFNNLSIPKESVEKIVKVLPQSSHEAIKDLCNYYEDYILDLREKLESAIVSSNFKLYLANNQIENLQEALKNRIKGNNPNPF